MSGLKEKLGIKVFVILLFSVFVLAGLTVTQAYGQPLDSPLYNHTKTEIVESMNAPADANNSSADANGPVQALGTFKVGCSIIPGSCTGYIAPCYESVPVMSAAGEIVFILTLTGGACWAILRKKRS